MLTPYEWVLAIAFLFCCLSWETNGSVRFVHCGHRRQNTTHVIPAQVHQSHHQVRHNHTWIRQGAKFNHTQSAPGWQVVQRNASLTSSNPWPVGQRNASWTNSVFHPQQPIGVAPPASAWIHHNQTTWSGPGYNQTTWRTFTTNQTHYDWPQGVPSQQPAFGVPIPVNFPQPGNVWAPQSPTYNATLNGTLTTYNNNTGSSVPVGNQQLAALSPPNAGGATYIAGGPSVGTPSKPNVSSHPYANLFN